MCMRFALAAHLYLFSYHRNVNATSQTHMAYLSTHHDDILFIILTQHRADEESTLR